ncbi:MAG: zinc ribbon domain-containing protein [Prevotella sp.]|nr:zinc ribbon domain-containing protein [Prevotella sp.]
MKNKDRILKKLLYILYIIATIATLTACYQERPAGSEQDAGEPTDSMTATTDSMPTDSLRHYGVGYNFVVRHDSLTLIAQQPEEHVSQLETDSFAIPHDKHLAVMDIHTVPQDSIDSVWVQLISEDGISGWIHESTLLQGVVPTDPISQFIMFFSDSHLLIALGIVTLLIGVYALRTARRRDVPIVHFRDIPSFYPTLLCIIVACSATFYASLQMFGADQWQHFYYHPSLNPFSLPPIIAIFIASVWAMLVIGIATVEDVRHHLRFEDAVIYLAGLCGVCAVLYIIFSISTLYYIGYLLLIAYIWFAIKKYKPFHTNHYLCGACGKRMYHQGKCPHCGAINE